MEPWEEKFRETCLALKTTGKKVTELDYEGIVTAQKILKCPKGHGDIYAGMEIDIGKIITAGNAIYCPTCDEVTLLEIVTPTFSTAPEIRFLEILKNRLIERGAVEPVTVGDPCPVCNKPTNVFYSHDFQGEGQWTICPDSDCIWPGDHKTL